MSHLEDLATRYRNAWREAYAEDRAERSQDRRRFAAILILVALAGGAFGFSAALFRVAMIEAPALDLAGAVITGIVK